MLPVVLTATRVHRLLRNVDKDGGEDDDRTTVHNAGGVDDPHE